MSDDERRDFAREEGGAAPEIPDELAFEDPRDPDRMGKRYGSLRAEIADPDSRDGASALLNDKADSIDRRHLETIVSKMTSKAKVLDPGDSSFIKGQDIDRNVLERWNAENGTPYSAKLVSIATTPKKALGRNASDTYKDKSGKTIIAKGSVVDEAVIGNLLAAGIKDIKVLPLPIQFEGALDSKQTVVTKGHDNWFSNLGYENVYQQLARGATYGQVDTLNDPRSRVMTGKLVNVGEGHELTNNPKTKDKANNVANKMTNFFGDMKNLFK
jgi:hypothetical protein